MYSQCPACATLFRVGEAFPNGGDLRVRCGMCAEIFDPRSRYAEQLPPVFRALVRPASGRSSAVHGTDRRPPQMKKLSAVEAVAAFRRKPADQGVPDGEQAESGMDWHLTSALEMDQRPGSAREAPARGTGWWVLGVLGMVLLLVGQIFWFQRDELADYPELRPVLGVMCTVGGCELPLRRDLEQLQLLRAQVTDHPDREAVLVASATLMNNAGFRQPYPLLKLSLLDSEQKVVGERWFHPEDYLEDPVQRDEWQRGMPRQQAVAVRFAVRDPGSGSAQYVFDYQ